jgi:hypothetical protein
LPLVAERPGNFAEAFAYCLYLTCSGFRGRLEKLRCRIGSGRLAMKTSKENTNVGSPFLIARVLHGFGRVQFGAAKEQLGPRRTPPMQRKIPGRKGGGHVER